jgi:DNA-binding transcriptional LysR family regulator
VVRAVRGREAEFGINIQGAHDAELVSIPLLQDRFVLVCRDDHPLAGRKRIGWKQLEAHALIIAGHESGNRHLLDAALAGEALRLQSFYEVQHSSTALGMVAEGVAAAVVPELALQKGSYPRLRMVALANPVVSRTIVLLSRRKAYLAPAAQALYDLIRATAAKLAPR